MRSAIDLFAGAGGLSLGLKEAGFETVMALDNDEDACATFRHAMRSASVINADARPLSFSRWRGVDLVAGGPPCQPFSTGGLRRGYADGRDLLPTFVRAVLEIAPRSFILENVPGLASKRHEGYMRDVLGPLFERYRVAGPVLLNAADFGVPQGRKRIVVIGSRDATPQIPSGDANRRVPAGCVIDAKPIGKPNLSRVVYAKTPDLRPDPYHGQLFNGGGRPINLEKPAPTILASAGGNKTHFLDLGRRVPAYHDYLMRGGKPLVGDLPEARRLTVEESALLQTFPPSMVFSGARSSQYMQIGNAVPPMLAQWLGIIVAETMTSRRGGRAA